MTDLKQYDVRVFAETIKDLKQKHDDYDNEVKSGIDQNIKTDKSDLSGGQIKEWQQLCAKLLQQNLVEQRKFFQTKTEKTLNTFNNVVETYDNNSLELQDNVENLQKQLDDGFIYHKNVGSYLEEYIESVIIAFNAYVKGRQVFTIWKAYHQKKKQQKNLNAFLDKRLNDKLSSKVFSSWRSQTGQKFYEKSINQASEKNVTGVQENYIKIIQMLKQKIAETDELIKIKRQQKAEFIYGLTKNLMKNIGDLQMQVISLNQQNLKGAQVEVSDTTKFLQTMTGIIEEKIQTVNTLKYELNNQMAGDSRQKGKKQSISFQNPPIYDSGKI